MQWPRAHLRVRECWFRSRLQWVGAWQIFTISVVPHTATCLWPLLAAVSPSHVFVPQPATLWYPALMRLGLMGTVLVCHIPLCLPRVGFSAGLARWIRSFFSGTMVPWPVIVPWWAGADSPLRHAAPTLAAAYQRPTLAMTDREPGMRMSNADARI